MNKQELRKKLRARFVSAAARDAESLRMCRHVLESSLFQAAKVIGGYMPMPREADVTPILLEALAQGKNLALPRCGTAPEMTFHRVSSLDELHPGAYGLLEPAADLPVIPVEDIDLMLVPLEGIDREGFRLGKGGGYYDKALAAGQVMTMGCALSWQWVESVPREDWDIRLHACADENEIHLFM